MRLAAADAAALSEEKGSNTDGLTKFDVPLRTILVGEVQITTPSNDFGP